MRSPQQSLLPGDVLNVVVVAVCVATKELAPKRSRIFASSGSEESRPRSGAQTSKVFADILDNSSRGPLLALRHAGARPGPALAYALLRGAAPLLISYSFYRFECALRSAVLSGVVGVGGLGQELTVSLQSRNWDEVWTLIATVLVLSAAVDAWSSRVRADTAVAATSDRIPGSAGPAAGRRAPRSRWARWSSPWWLREV